MKRYWKVLSWSFGLTLLFLILTNPTEKQFLNRVSQDYGAEHFGNKPGTEQLLNIGHSTRSSYLIFSTYHYEYGSIGVSYFGLANGTFFLGSSAVKPRGSIRST